MKSRSKNVEHSFKRVNKKLLTRITLLFAVVVFSLINTQHALAAVSWTDCLGGPEKDVATIQCLVPLFENVVVAVIELSGVVLFIMLVAGGFAFITSGGNPKQLEQARKTLTYAIIGLVIIVSAYLIIQIISVFTGVPDLNKFTIPGTTP